MSAKLLGRCGRPGPGDRHCSHLMLHKSACHDHVVGDHWSPLAAFVHDCNDERCTTQHFEQDAFPHPSEWVLYFSDSAPTE